jgi:Bardet-Biedl syndrome 7 protein
MFASHKQKIIGITKRGKEFFKLTSSLTESINHIFVEETKIWTACEYIYNIYENGQDAGFYMCHDQIHAMLMEYVVKSEDFDAVLGCQDNTIRIVSGSNLAYEVPTTGPVMSLCSMHGDESKIRRESASIIYGTNTGSIANVTLDGSRNLTAWTLHDEKKASITAMRAYDLTQDGSLEIVLSRDDGRVEIYAQDASLRTPDKIFTRDLGYHSYSILYIYIDLAYDIW